MSNGKICTTLAVSLRQVRSFSTTQSNLSLVKAPIQLFGLEGRYAHAIYSAASKQNKLDAVDKDFQGLKSLFVTEKKLAEILKTPTLSKEQKKNAVNELAIKRNATDVTVNTLTLLAENGRLGRLLGIVNAFGKLMSAHKGEVNAVITTAKPIDAAQKKELDAILLTLVKKGSKLNVEMKTNSDILGGMIVEVGDRYIDMSIASKVKVYSDIVKETL